MEVYVNVLACVHAYAILLSNTYKIVSSFLHIMGAACRNNCICDAIYRRKLSRRSRMTFRLTNKSIVNVSYSLVIHLVLVTRNSHVSIKALRKGLRRSISFPLRLWLQPNPDSDRTVGWMNLDLDFRTRIHFPRQIWTFEVWIFRRESSTFKFHIYTHFSLVPFPLFVWEFVIN